jgi:hypothetical protein
VFIRSTKTQTYPSEDRSDDRTALEKTQGIVARLIVDLSLITNLRAGPLVEPEREMRPPHLHLIHCSEPIELPEDFPLSELPADLHQTLDHIWRPSERLFQAAWVCSLLELEAITGMNLRSDVAIPEAIERIDRARFRFYEQHVEVTPFPTPSCYALQFWCSIYGVSELVSNARASLSHLLDCHGQESTLDILGNCRLWREARNEAQRALARSIRVIDPSIERWTSDTQISPIVEGVHKLRRYEPQVSYYLGEMDELLREESRRT